MILYFTQSFHITWNSSEKKNSPYSPTYLFNHYYISLWVHKYLIYTRGYKFNTTLFTLSLKKFLLEQLGALQSGSCALSNCPHPFWNISSFFGIINYSILILYFPYSRPQITLLPFTRECYLETKIWMPGVSLLTSVFSIHRLSQQCMYTNPHINLCLFLFIFKIFIYYLAALGLSFSMQDLQPPLRHVRYNSLTRDRTGIPSIGCRQS